MKNFAKVFPILDQYTYLNTAASGLLPLPVKLWRDQHDMDFSLQGSILKEKQGAILEKVREKVGVFFNCSAKRVALVPNFSYGFNTLIAGLPINSNVLLLKGDYPSVNWPFTSRNFNVQYASIKENLEQSIEAAFKIAQPDIFAFSLVQWLSGIKIDQEFLKALKSQYPDTLFLADATQYVGTEVFDFENSALDAIGASCYKWMHAGYGNGIFLFKEAIVSRVNSHTTGFNSLQGKYKPQEGNFLGQFEPGHQDTLNYGSLSAAIDFIESIGIQTIQSKSKIIANAAKIAFLERGWLESNVANRTDHGLFFTIPGDESLVKKLRQENIIVAARGEGIRVGFHYFNTLSDLTILLEAIEN